MTSQLTATTSAGGVVMATVTWQSRAPNVATVSATGLVTATGAGTTTITAAASGATGGLSMAVEPPANVTTTLTRCATLTTPGHYVLTSDLAPVAGQPCLVLSGLGGVQLDCRGHALSGVALSVVHTVTISNCTLLSSVSVQNGTNVELLQNTITSANGGSAVYLSSGSNNQVLQSTITGGYDGSQAGIGTDDGILLVNETGDTIQGNTISGFYDTAVEGIDGVANTTVANNTFVNIGVAAIGAYWCTDWNGNVISGNNASMAPTMAWVTYEDGALCGGTITPPAFSGNQFIGNVFRNPSQGTFVPPLVAGASMHVVMTGAVEGNVLKNNDFGTSAGPLLMPLTGFMDGGGNICGPLNTAVSNFACTGGGFQSWSLTMPWSTWLAAPPGARGPSHIATARKVGAR